MREFSEEEIRATVLYKLARRGCWGERYLPLDSLVNWLGKRVKRDGRVVRRAVSSLKADGYVMFHKKGKTISLNPKVKGEVIAIVRKFFRL
jgi:hypothetical protein